MMSKIQNLNGTHNKDYSVVKTFKAGLSGLAFLYLTKVINIFGFANLFVMFLNIFSYIFSHDKVKCYF